MARLLLLNGPPGVGKSTLARAWCTARPDRVVVDPDELRRDAGSAEAARTQALSMIASHLDAALDVVVPQLAARVDQLERFEQVADDARARFVHVVLVDAAGDPVGRFHRRSGDDPWHARSRAAVAAEGGDDVLRRYAAGLDAVIAARPDAVLVGSAEGDVAGTLAALEELLTQR